MICGPGELKVWETTHNSFHYSARTVNIISGFREAREAERTEALAGAVYVSVDAKREPKPYACTYNVSHGCME